MLINNQIVEAVGRNDYEKIKSLINDNPDASNNVIMFAVWTGNYDVLKFVIELGADVSYDGSYALRVASERNYISIIKLLIESGIDVHADDDAAIQWAAISGNIDSVRLLLELGANINSELISTCMIGVGELPSSKEEIICLIDVYLVENA
jgi:ankyrin repeat protein